MAVDVITVVDCELLASAIQIGAIRPGSFSSPTNLGSYSSSDNYIYMISRNGSVNNNQAKSELSIKVNPGDTIRWAMTSFESNADYTPYLYNSHFNPSTSLSGMRFLSLQLNTYLPPVGAYDNGDPNLDNSQGVPTRAVVGQTDVLQSGSQIQYTMSFKVVNNMNGQPLGYFTWDPFITIS